MAAGIKQKPASKWGRVGMMAQNPERPAANFVACTKFWIVVPLADATGN